MERIQEITYWLTAWLDDSVQTEKDPAFLAFLQQDTNREDFENMLKKYRKARKIVFCHRICKETAWEKTMQKVRRQKHLVKLYRLIVSATAAAVLVIGLLVFFIPRADRRTESDLLVSGAALQRAFIQTEDGQEYLLSDTAEKIVSAYSGVDIVVDSDKNVRYVVKDSVRMAHCTNTLVVPRGGFYSIVLSDGTKIRLNAESRLIYPVAFTGQERVVQLTGEAYFEVAAEIDHPFRVICGTREVVVTGTKFNISTYTGELCATLAEGTVSVANGREQQCLQPGQQAVVSDEEICVRQVETSLYTAWVEGKFVFDNARLEDIVKTLTRWYDVEFDFKEPSLKELTFTLSAPCDENLLFVVKLLEGVSVARFQTEGKKIGISAVY